MVEITTGQLLTITSGKMLCTVSELYDALNKITGDILFTHMLPGASRFAEGPIVEAHPWAGELPKYSGEGTEEAVLGFVEDISEIYGYTHEVPYLGDTWVSRDPIATLAEMKNSYKD